MKRYIYAMAFPKAEALRRAQHFSEDILEHIIKILVYNEIRSEDVLHWKGEIAAWLKSVDELTVKPSNKPLKEKDVRETTFICMGDELSDYKSSLEIFRRDNLKGKFNYEDKDDYPDFEATYQLSDDLMSVCFEIMKRTIPMICSKEYHSRQDFINVLDDVFDNYI